MQKVISVVGARPNFIKISPILEELDKRKINNILVHTGQHYSSNMSDNFFKDLKIRQPEINLNAGSSNHARQTAEIMIGLEDVFIKEKPSIVIVVGDVNSTLAAAITASKLGIKIAHVEAGLRSFDFGMPEEINRALTDRISDYLFCTEKSGVENLKKEGVNAKKIFLVGNVMIDSIVKNIKKAGHSKIIEELGLKKTGENYCVLTAHRPENVDSEKNLKVLIDIIDGLQKIIKVICSVHPRTMEKIKEYGMEGKLKKMKNIVASEPIGYLDFLFLTKNAKFAVTDSGGLQEETSYLKIPCLTIRKNTERPATVEKGTNIVTGLDKKRVLEEVGRILKGNAKKGGRIDLWDGKAAERIVKIIESV